MGVFRKQKNDVITIAPNAQRWTDVSKKQYTKELSKRDLHDLDNHNGVITQLEPEVLECEVKWALGSMTTNRERGDDGIPAGLFQVLKENAV